MRLKALAEELARKVKEHVAAELKQVQGAIADLEERIAHLIRTPGPKGDKGDTGPAPDITAIEKRIAAEMEESANLVADAMVEIDRRVDVLISQKIAALSLPKGDQGGKGDKGEPGERGEKGEPGKDGASVHPDTILLMVREAADKLVGNLPKPKDGKDGRDGFSLEDFDATLAEDGRTLLLKFSRGEYVHTCAVRIPSVQYRGVFKDGDEYWRGDFATWGGSIWHCNVDGAKSKPDSGSGEWTLAVKRGRDGKEVTSTR